MNHGFACVYGFDAPAQPAMTHRRPAGWLVLGVVEADAIGWQRPMEFDYLMSDAFGELLQRTGCHIHQGPVQLG